MHVVIYDLMSCGEKILISPIFHKLVSVPPDNVTEGVTFSGIRAVLSMGLEGIGLLGLSRFFLGVVCDCLLCCHVWLLFLCCCDLELPFLLLMVLFMSTGPVKW